MEKRNKKTIDHHHHHHHRVTTMTDLGENCITTILSLTTPRDACRLSLVSQYFKSAGESDVVWDKFVPLDVDTSDVIVSHSDSAASAAAKSKKELYLYLCDHPVLICDRKMSFSLDKWSGKKCYMISARALRIPSVDNPGYWKWISHSRSRFREAAELVHVWELEIRGRIETRLLSPSTKYNAYLVYKITVTAANFDKDGCSGRCCVGVECPVLVSVARRDFGSDYPALWKTRQDVANKRSVFLAPQRLLKSHRQETNAAKFPSQRSDGWWEIELGEFDCGEHEDGELEMIVYENYPFKDGLVVQGIEVRPKG